MKSTNKHAGRPARQGKPFDPERRAALLTYMREGSSFRVACKRARVNHTTVYRWLDEGRKETSRREHREFAELFDEADAELVGKAAARVDELTRCDDPHVALKAALEILKARDSRFGDRRLKNRALLLDIERAEIEREMSRLRYKAAVEALEKGGDAAAIIVGIEALLDPRSPISTAAREEIRKALASGSIRTLAARDLGDPDDKPDSA